jgi:hypothetical protein
MLTIHGINVCFSHENCLITSQVSTPTLAATIAISIASTVSTKTKMTIPLKGLSQMTQQIKPQNVATHLADQPAHIFFGFEITCARYVHTAMATMMKLAEPQQIIRRLYPCPYGIRIRDTGVVSL